MLNQILVQFCVFSNLSSLILQKNMLGGFKKGLKIFDLYQAVPNEVSQGTISGACISVLSIALLLILTIYSFFRFLQPKIITDLIIDQKHLSEKLRVNIQIQFPKYPCSFLSLDIENDLKVHLVNVEDNLKKYVLPSGQLYSDKNKTNDQKMNRIMSDVEQKNGCRAVGWFEIDRVPGNFHFSSHGYGSFIPELISKGIRHFDMSHKIKLLSFGDPNNYVYGGNSLGGFNSEKEIEEAFMGISYTYFLDIIEHNTIEQNSEKGRQSYLYTARLNEVILAQLPLVYFKYETNPMTVLEIVQKNQWHLFWIDFVGILGGIFTVSAIIDHIIHSSIRFLIEKQRLNKLN